MKEINYPNFNSPAASDTGIISGLRFRDLIFIRCRSTV